jgi:hypothetical protein
MNRSKRVPRLTVALAGLAGILSWPGVVAGGPASAAVATWPTVDCRVSAHSPGTQVAVCDRTSTTTTTCSLIPLPAAPAGYLQRLATPRSQEWAAIDCPGPYPFGGVILMPDGGPAAS